MARNSRSLANLPPIISEIIYLEVHYHNPQLDKVHFGSVDEYNNVVRKAVTTDDFKSHIQVDKYPDYEPLSRFLLLCNARRLVHGAKYNISKKTCEVQDRNGCVRSGTLEFMLEVFSCSP